MRAARPYAAYWTGVGWEPTTRGMRGLDGSSHEARKASTTRRRVAYTLLGNPFLHERNSPEQPLMNGPVPAQDVLRLHLQQLGTLRTQQLAAILLLMPQDISRREVAGYRNSTVAASILLPAPLEVISVSNNTLGSYGMFLHGFASTRGRFDFYIFCEDDYAPTMHHFDAALVRMHEATFGDAPSERGVLAGLLQGKPAEPESPRALHLETSHIMSARGLAHLFAHTYGAVGWRGSMAERMIHLLRASRNGVDNPYYGGGIQEGFGLLCTDAGIEMRDWSRAYRSPYWNHKFTVDWSGAASNFTLPMTRMLFSPIQLLYSNPRRVKSCCAPSQAACKGTVRACFVDLPLPGSERPDGPNRATREVVDCCAARGRPRLP